MIPVGVNSKVGVPAHHVHTPSAVERRQRIAKPKPTSVSSSTAKLKGELIKKISKDRKVYGKAAASDSTTTEATIFKLDLSVVRSVENDTKMSGKGKNEMAMATNIHSQGIDVKELESFVSNQPCLTLLNLAGNSRLAEACDFAPPPCLRNLSSLVVLNLSFCGLKNLPASSLFPTSLCALVLNNNQLTGNLTLNNLPALNTIVLSHNAVTDLNVSALSQLAKLSISHNQLVSIPDLSSNPLLKELRCTHNQITAVPETLTNLKKLEILDLGHNAIREFFNIIHVSTMRLRQLNLRGNPVAKLASYAEKLPLLVRGVSILDGKRIDEPWTEKQKRKREADQEPDLLVVQPKPRSSEPEAVQLKQSKKSRGDENTQSKPCNSESASTVSVAATTVFVANTVAKKDTADEEAVLNIPHQPKEKAAARVIVVGGRGALIEKKGDTTALVSELMAAKDLGGMDQVPGWD